MAAIRTTICRVCSNHCALAVEVDGDRITKVTGNPADPLFRGYSCVKGRAQAANLRHPARLLTSMKRRPDGALEPIEIERAMDEIAQRLQHILDRDGPRAIAGYWGTMALATMPTCGPLAGALFDAIGTPMRFDPNTIDKSGKMVAQSMLGYWHAPPQGFDRPEAILLIGINPLITYTGFPAGSPHTWLRQLLDSGTRLIVIDPRRTQVAAKATWHLRAKPGYDAAILAAMIRIILAEGLGDTEFLHSYTRGADQLRTALEPFEPDAVAAQAGLDVDELVAATRGYASARRGYAMAGTGPSMSGGSTLVEYLVLVLETLCGRWLRAGEPVVATPSLLGRYRPRAEVRPPDTDWRLGEPLRVRGLYPTRAGMPTAALADEILTPGAGRVRALISWGGNPAIAFPDQNRTIAALQDLELLVQVDPWLSETARFADYVIAPTMPLEVPATTAVLDWLASRNVTGYGLGQAYAQYTEAITEVPPGSDLIQEWEFFYGLMVRMGYPVRFAPMGPAGGPRPPLIELSSTSKPTTEELLVLVSAGSRIPLEVVRANEGGQLYPDDLIIVEPGPTDGDARLDIAAAPMLAELARLDAGQLSVRGDGEFPFRLLCRRMDHVYNTSAKSPLTDRGIPYNPAFLCSADLAALGAIEGDVIELCSPLGGVHAIAHADDAVLTGTVSMAFGYGGAPDRDDQFRAIGTSPNRIVALDQVFDPFTGQPRMSNVPIAVRLARPATKVSSDRVAVAR